MEFSETAFFIGQGTHATFWGGSGFQADFDLCNLEMLLPVLNRTTVTVEHG